LFLSIEACRGYGTVNPGSTGGMDKIDIVRSTSNAGFNILLQLRF
jgi:hypothetical protein